MGAREGHTPFYVPLFVGIAVLGVAGEHKDIPLEAGGCRVVVRLAPADDVSKDVIGPGVGSVGTTLARLPTVAVVAEGAVDLLRRGMNGDPLRAIAGGGLDRVASAPGVDQHLGLGIEAIRRGETDLA